MEFKGMRVNSTNILQRDKTLRTGQMIYLEEGLAQEERG